MKPISGNIISTPERLFPAFAEAMAILFVS
jgi:hypothetical protein